MILQLARKIKASWLLILQVHLIFTLLGVIALGPLFGLLLQGLLELSGSSAVSDGDIALLFLSPLGIVSGLLLVGVFLAINAMEIGALLAISVAANHRLRCSPVQATIFALRHWIDLLQLTLHLSVRVLAYLLPFALSVGAIAWLLLNEYDINFYLTERPPQFLVAIIAAFALLVLCLWLLGKKFLSWCLALPLVLFADLSNRGALAESERLTFGSRTEILRIYLGSLATAGLLGLIPIVLFDLFGGWIVSSHEGSLSVLVFLLGGLALIWLIMNFFVAAFTLSSICITTSDLYDRLGPPLRVDLMQGELAGLPLPALGWSVPRIALCVFTVAAMATVTGGWLLNGIQTEDRVAIIAHRGASSAAPENTLASIRKAVIDGADWVEIDVQETRDGQIVVVHDSDFMKLANNPLKVRDGDLARIQTLDVGSWFDPQYKEETVPTLEQALEETRGRAGLLIELKYYGYDEQLEQRVVDIVEAAGMSDDVSVMSLKLPGVRKLQALRPQWTTGLLAATALGDLSKTDVDFLAVSQRMITARFIKRSHTAGKQVMVWTVNDPLSMSKWISMGVDGVITDEPEMARTVLEERSKMSSAERLVLQAALFLGKPVPENLYRDKSP